MPTTQFSIGRDVQLVILGPSGQVDLSFVTSFEARQLTSSVRVERLDGVPMGAEIPKGWEGSFELERGSNAVDDFIAAMEASYFAKGLLPASTVYQYVAEVDGSTSTYQYNNVVFKLVSAGAWKGDAAVKQKLEFFAAQRISL
jgi:hypothetical protein